jgi:osmoprotectant transport system substrate-binding protein
MVSTTEFLERSDGLPGVAEVYGGFNFLNTVSMDPGLRYAAISERQGDVMDAFSTDGKLIEFDLVVLEDDKGFFPPYYVAPLLNGEFAEKNPDVAETLSVLKDSISESEMQQMNFEVDNNGVNEKEVARNFLKEKGFIK